jgi:hypothetical protein
MKLKWSFLSSPRRYVFLLAIILAPLASFALVQTEDRGTWPAGWPVELEPLRKQARTIGVAHGLQENIYDIRFAAREEFERAWPAIFSLLTPGSRCTVYLTNSAPSKTWGTTNTFPAVRIFGPSEGYSISTKVDPARTGQAIKKQVEEGKALHAGVPWPAEIISADGSLPEYVISKEVDGKMHWLPADLEKDRREKKTVGFYNRARVDVEIVADGTIIDLSRIQLPSKVVLAEEQFAVPALSSAQRGAIISDATHAVTEFVHLETKERDKENIPKRLWGENISGIKPQRVVHEQINARIVLGERAGIEFGYYVNNAISSFRPQPQKFLEFVQISQPEDKSFGTLYRYADIRRPK